MEWKAAELKKLKNNDVGTKTNESGSRKRLRIVAHLGDRDDDVDAAALAGVPGLKVRENKWFVRAGQ